MLIFGYIAVAVVSGLISSLATAYLKREPRRAIAVDAIKKAFELENQADDQAAGLRRLVGQ